MLTRLQLQAFSDRFRISLQTIERDYIQAAFLSLLYEQTQDFIFKGGTCLRLVYRSSRFSEDLDFHTTKTAEEVQEVCRNTTKRLVNFGIESMVKDEWKGREGYAFHLTYAGPLANGRAITRGGVEIDVSLRREEVEGAETAKTFITPPYDDVYPFIVTHETRGEIFAGKVRAVLDRKLAAPRDLYDLWFLLNVGEAVDEERIKRKLAKVDKTFTYEPFEKQLKEMQKRWVGDLERLLTSVPPYEEIRDLVLEKFKLLK